jgi:hypothetical protein
MGRVSKREMSCYHGRDALAKGDRTRSGPLLGCALGPANAGWWSKLKRAGCPLWCVWLKELWVWWGCALCCGWQARRDGQLTVKRGPIPGGGKRWLSLRQLRGGRRVWGDGPCTAIFDFFFAPVACKASSSRSCGPPRFDVGPCSRQLACVIGAAAPAPGFGLGGALRLVGPI